jgi:AraC family transcriptional regulator
MTNAARVLPATRWASMLPEGMQATGEMSFDNGVLVRRFLHVSYETSEMPACAQHLFACRLSGQVAAERKLGSRWQRANTRRGSITIVPAHQASSWRLNGSGEILHFYFPPGLLRHLDEDQPDDVPIIEHLGAFDPHLTELVETFAGEMRHRVKGYALYAEALLTQIAISLLRRHTKAARGREGRAAGLRRTVEDRLAEYIDANLHADISLSALAALAWLKQAQFTKLFRVSFGSSPYQYVLRRRVETAKALLREGKLGVAQIAIEVGCAHQAHLTTMFRRFCGSTPAAYRSAMRS